MTRERPILFSAPMVRAILSGRKTVTRRAVKPVGNDGGFVLVERSGGGWWPYRSDDGESSFVTLKDRGGRLCEHEIPMDCPFGQPGDVLWVREKWQAADGSKRAARIVSQPRPDVGWIEYAATCDDPPPIWRPGIHMFRWASRIDLRVTGVRVERLQDISEADARAEGAPCIDEASGREVLFPDASKAGSWRLGMRVLWESINGPGSWGASPWVWAIEFERIKP